MRISIIVPARNEEKALGDLLASLQAQKAPNVAIEIIVVDHESTDDTKRVALQGGARVVTKRGGTISSVRNLGASVATGDILAFVDSDCTVAEDWLAAALPHLREPSVGVVGSYYLMPPHPPTWVRRVLQ